MVIIRGVQSFELTQFELRNAYFEYKSYLDRSEADDWLAEYEFLDEFMQAEQLNKLDLREDVLDCYQQLCDEAEYYGDAGLPSMKRAAESVLEDHGYFDFVEKKYCEEEE